MAFEQKNNSGSLFRNDRKETENHPNAKGKALIGGVWYWVSAWTKEPRQGGDKYQSLSFEEMTEEQVAKYGGGGGGDQSRQQQGRQSYGQQNGRAPAPRPQRPAPQAPYGDEKQFAEADIPF